MRLIVRLAALALGLSLLVVAYTVGMARLAPGTPPAMAPRDQWADRIVVDKPAREMVLMREGEAVRRYAISLGAAPQGHKRQEGDERTPEGEYLIDWRNGRSVSHLSLHISYPDAADRAAAAAVGIDPGGAIMIHGLPNGWGFLGRLHRLWDWTDGCVAVTDAEMREIWSLVPDGTPITILGDS